MGIPFPESTQVLPLPSEISFLPKACAAEFECLLRNPHQRATFQTGYTRFVVLGVLAFVVE